VREKDEIGKQQKDTCVLGVISAEILMLAGRPPKAHAQPPLEGLKKEYISSSVAKFKP